MKKKKNKALFLINVNIMNHIWLRETRAHHNEIKERLRLDGVLLQHLLREMVMSSQQVHATRLMLCHPEKVGPTRQSPILFV